MGLTFAATTGAGDAPNVEDGVYYARFLGVELREHKDWAGTNQWGKPDDGSRFHWLFRLFDDAEATQPLYDEGEMVELESVTNTSMNPKSNTAANLKGLTTKAEFEAFLEGSGPDADSLADRVCQVEVAHSEKGWPKIVNVTAVPQPRARAAGRRG